MILVGIQKIEGSKNGKQYSFNVLHFLDDQPFRGCDGNRVFTVTPTEKIDVTALKVGDHYDVYYYTGNNGRHYANGILPI